MIEELLKEDVIELDVEVKDWMEAVLKSGQLLLRDDKIEECYIESMIETVKEMGAYIVMAPGIAMPHARPEDGAKELGISIITLKDPVVFGNEEFDPVEIVIGLCSKDSKAHIEILQDLSIIIDSEEFLEGHRTCKTKKQLINLIERIYTENL